MCSALSILISTTQSNLALLHLDFLRRMFQHLIFLLKKLENNNFMCNLLRKFVLYFIFIDMTGKFLFFKYLLLEIRMFKFDMLTGSIHQKRKQTSRDGNDE